MSFVYVEYGHTVDGTGSIGTGGGVSDIIGANYKGDIGLGEITIDFLHLNEAIIGNIGFSQEHVHVTGHTSSDRMDGEADVHAALG